ncbi:serine protease Do [Tepidamorphus gemmatus]|uniref:Probable periplasmic serine endoprotease DegP-like n=1 Tax=Tepidamorphus gemmatus TaxID=747076 RepID=A0A4R3M4Z0_9HYPH|nr:serine protease Do [Tepidamorphus gemmatus]
MWHVTASARGGIARTGRIAALCLAAAMFGSLGAGSFAAAEARGAPESFADLSERLIDAVVNISTSQRVTTSQRIPTPRVPPGSPFEEFFEEFFNRRGEGDDGESRRPHRVNSLGSGFVIDPDGLVVTNNHVIAEADEIIVNFNDGTKLPAEVVGRDEKTDIAVLRVKPDKPLTAVSFGDSEALRVGDWVLAIGNPFGLGGTVTAGIVSARNRDINAGPYDSFIQTDASINRGNSGGPLFNMDGEVVGINTAIISPTGGSIGIGFAVPANIAQNVIRQLVEFGETRRGWLGVRIQSVTDEIAESLGMDRAEGALVAGVSSGGPAEAAGIETGDVILEFDGRRVGEMRELPRIVADTAIGKTVDVLVLRKGERETFKVTVGRLEEGEQMAALDAGESDELAGEDGTVTISALGVDLSDLTDELRSRYAIGDSVEGAVVTDVAPDGPASARQISAGDVIVEVAQEKVTTAADVRRELDALKARGKKSALLLVANPAGELRFVVVPFQD